MTEIKGLDLKALHQEEDYGFHQLMLIETAKCTDAKVVPLHNAYVAAFTHFGEVLKPGGKDPMTILLLDVDTQRDQCYSGSAQHARSTIKHFDPDKATIGKEVSDIFDKYGNPCALPYIEENGVIENLIQELKVYDNPPPSDDRPVIESVRIQYNRLAAIGLKEWIDQLEKLNNQFIQLFSERNTARAAAVTGASKAGREAADAAYRAVVKRINALIEVNGEEDYIDVVNNMNKLIDYQQATLAARSTRNTKKKNDKPVTDDKPVIDDKPVTDDKPVIDDKPATDDRPVIE